MVAGNQIHVGGAISPAAVGDTVAIFAQPYGQASFVEVARVQTTTNGVYDFITIAADPDHVQGNVEGQDECADQRRSLASPDAVAYRQLVRRPRPGARQVLRRPLGLRPAPEPLRRLGEGQEGLPEQAGGQALQASWPAERPEPRSDPDEHEPGGCRLHLRHQPDPELPPPINAVGDSREAVAGSHGLSAVRASYVAARTLPIAFA